MDQGDGGGGGGTTETAADRITRVEERTPDGNGYAEGITYDSAADIFTVDNLAFDGGNTYQRDDVVASLPGIASFAVYENDNVFLEPITGAPIGQFEHKAVRAVSASGNVEFAIVRTGAYIPYGFGGFLYQRNTGVVLPTSGQAGYTGDYGSIRDFNGQGGLQYVTGVMTAAIDFNDFNAGDAVQGQVTNRQIFDTAGTNITASVAAGIPDGLATLPVLRFRVRPGVLSPNGEIQGDIDSFYVDTATGATTAYEVGQYYAVIAGDNAEVIVGIIVVETEPDDNGLTIRETGGFILHRP